MVSRILSPRTRILQLALPWRLSLFWGVLVILGTQHPFTIDPWPVTVPSGSFWMPRLKGLDPPFNVLMFMPLGWAFHTQNRRLLSGLVAGFCFSSLIELGQHYIAFRVPVVEDVFFNTLGAGVGWWLAPQLTRLNRRVGGRTRNLAAILLAGFVLASALPPLVTAKLWFWQQDARLITGREQAGNYPWKGEVQRARLWVGTSTSGSPDWDLHRDGEGVFEALVQRIEAEQAFVLQMNLLGSPRQRPKDDLARILVWSDGARSCNLLVGQAMDDIVVRIRTRVTPVVGQFPSRTEPLEMPALRPGQAGLVSIRYQDGKLSGQVDDRIQQGRLQYLPPHNGVRRFWLPAGHRGASLYGFSAALVLAAALAGRRRPRTAFALGWGLSIVTALIQVPLFGAGLLLTGLLAGCLGALFGVFSCAPAVDSLPQD